MQLASSVPAIRDRVAQSAAVLVLEPIFEADLQPEQYAYRADRSALDAVRHVHKLLNTGRVRVTDRRSTARAATAHNRDLTHGRQLELYDENIRHHICLPSPRR